MTHAKIDTKQLLASVNIVDVINGYVPLTKKGKDHVGCCPFHEEQDGSFHVTESKQMYYCYGCQSGGDALDFVQQYLNVDFVKAAGHLGGGLIQDGSPTRQTITREPVASPYDQYTPVIPIPSHATPMRDGRKTVPIVNPSKEHAASSWQPSAVHTYHTADGGRYGYVLRAEVGGGKKITPAALWCRRDNNTEGYALMPFPEQRPLYNLHRISDRTDRQVVIVEGEKAADYGQRVLGDSQVVTTWVGGTAAVAKTDWTPLAGRRIILSPDNDEPGDKAMDQIREILTGLGCTGIKTVKHDADAAKGFDIADLGDIDRPALIAYLKHHIVPDVPAAPIVPAVPEKPIVPDVPRDEPPMPTEEPPEYPECQEYDDEPSGPLEWGDPIDALNSFEPPALDTALLPAAIGDFAKDQSELIGVDPGVIGMFALAACASAIHDDFKVQAKEHETGWTESARLWVAVVGDPSVKKSPSMTKATGPLRKIDYKLAEENGQKMYDYEIAKKIANKAIGEHIKVAMDHVAAGGQAPECAIKAPEHPETPRATVSDTTIEKLAEIMTYNPRGILVLRDELAGWFGSMDAYSTSGGNKDRPLWLEAYNGGPRAIDRIGRGSSVVPNWSCCIAGGIQPDSIRTIAGKLSNDGLLQRFMVIQARPAAPGVDRPADDRATEVYNDTLTRLFALEPNGYDAIKLSNGALEVSREMNRFIQDCSSMAKTHPSLYAHIAKWEGLFPRLVLTYYIIDCATKRVYPDGPIAAAYAKRVYRFITEYLFAHAYSFYSDLLAESDQTADAKKIADLILARQWTTVTHRDIKRGDKRFADMPARDLHQTLESLAMMDWVRISGDSRVAVRDGMVKSWDVNPRIHEAFAGRAEESRKRRALSKAKLKALQEARKTE